MPPSLFWSRHQTFFGHPGSCAENENKCNDSKTAMIFVKKKKQIATPNFPQFAGHREMTKKCALKIHPYSDACAYLRLIFPLLIRKIM